MKHIICELTGYKPGTVDVSQGDRGSRAVSCRLMENGAPWMIPEGATARVAYTLPDGTEGLYDRRPDGSPMWEISGNIVTVELADQLMAQAGMVQMSILIIGPEGGQLATWPIRVTVSANQAARLTVPEEMPPYGAGFAGKIFFGGEDGTVTPLIPGAGVEIVRQEDGSYKLVASGGAGGGGGITEEKDPTVPAWAKQPQKPAYTAEEVGADPKGTAASAVSAHNVSDNAHNDIRQKLAQINAITTSKVSVADIVSNLTTNVANKPLSAAQGVVLKSLIDGLSFGKLDVCKLPEAITTALAQAKASGEFDGKDGSDAAVTAENVAKALGYVPASVAAVFDHTENPTFTNLLDDAGIEYGKILKTDGSVSDTAAALCTTGYIPIKQGQIVRMEDFALYNGGSCSVCLYGADYSFKNRAPYSVFADGNYYIGNSTKDKAGNVAQFTVLQPSSLGFIRICTNTSVIGKNPVLTVDEEITYEMGYGQKLNSAVKVEHSQVVNAPGRHGWNILPHERLNIAYSSIGRKPINTVAHFTDAAENFGYNVLKCDVRPTSDGELVCCHDAGFTFDSSGYITTYSASNSTAIRDVTAATVLGYSFKTGEHPCLVGDYLDLCRKYGKVAFVTIRNEYMDAVIPKLLEELRTHNMTHSTIINCMTYDSLVMWRQQDKTVMINYTLNAGVAIDQAQIDRAIGLGYCSLCGFGLTSSALEPSNTCDFDYARANGIRLLQAIAYKDGSPEACYAMGYDGCQIGYAWNPKVNGGSEGAYSKAEIDAIMGSYITDIDALVGGDG